jgi:hypothetical protein
MASLFARIKGFYSDKAIIYEIAFALLGCNTLNFGIHETKHGQGISIHESRQRALLNPVCETHLQRLRSQPRGKDGAGSTADRRPDVD